MKRTLPARLFALFSIMVLFLMGCGGSSTGLPSYEEMLSEKVLGDPSAPITIIDYSALTCPHCADFDLNTLPGLKAKYIDTGKAKLLYRDFPFNRTGLTAAMLARCSGASRYFEVLDLMYKNQAIWSSAGDPEKALIGILGMSQEKADACLSDKDLEDGITNMMAEAEQQYGVNATPTFIINGRKVVGSIPFSEFEGILDGLTP